MRRCPGTLRTILGAGFLLLFIFATNAGAEVLHVTDLDQRVGERYEATYSELLRLVFTDLNDESIANHSIEIRDLSDDAVQAYEGAMKLNSVDSVWIKSAGKRKLLLFINVTSDGQPGFTWGELNVLVLYDVGQKPQVLDAVDVSGDRFTSFWGDLHLHPKEDAVVFEYKHFNAGENFDGFAFLHVDGNRIKSLFDGFPYLYYGRSCTAEIEETGGFSTVRNPGSSYRDIVFNIKITGSRYKEDCDTLKSKTSRSFRLRAAWRRGAYRYVDGGAELKRMRRERNRLGFGD